MSEKSNEMSQQMLEIIEQKRRLAIEKRNKRLKEIEGQNPVSNKIESNSKSLPFISSNVSIRNQTMTNIKSKPHLSVNESPNKKSKISDNSDKPKETKIQIKGSLRLLSQKRFQIDVPYNTHLVNVFRNIGSREWDPNTKLWSFDISDYKKILLELKALSSVEFQFHDIIPERIMSALIEVRNRRKESIENIDLTSKMGPKLMETLYSFQTEGIKFGVRTGGRCLIADDMGLGKTIQAIGIAQWFREDWPLLIICPSSLRLQWRDSIIDWLPDIKEEDIFIVEKVNQILQKISITIISYDLMRAMRSQFTLDSKKFYNFVILDESHYIKSDSAARTEAVHLLAKSCKRVVLLTGTPALSRPMELFTQIKLIDPKLFNNKHEFGLRYCDAQQKDIWFRGGYARGRGRGGKGMNKKTVWNYSGSKNLDELRIILESTLLVRRLKTEVLKELTKKKREMIILSVDNVNKKLREKLKIFSNMREELKQMSFTANESDDNKNLFDWYIVSAFAKVEPVCHYLEQLLNKNIKLLCFCHHKQMMDEIQEVLAKKQINHIRIDGRTPLRDRREACEEFQTKTDCRVGLLSITACATGLNLTAASCVVFAELFWNPGILSQAEDRIHRIGQKKDVKIYYLVAKNTIDDMLWPLISRKLEVLNKAGLSKDNFKEATTALDSVEAEQHLITEFFESIDENDRKALMENDFSDK